MAPVEQTGASDGTAGANSTGGSDRGAGDATKGTRRERGLGMLEIVTGSTEGWPVETIGLPPGDDALRDVLHARPLDAARRAVPARVRVH